jgi:hypothetical protein
MASDMSARKSLEVAPLRIGKGRSGKASPSSRSVLSEHVQTGKTSEFTPPPTPGLSEHGEHREQEQADPARQEHQQFHHYLRAFYPFHPPCEDSSGSVTLPLNQGDIVLVHSVHTNGWADGTLLSSGSRGWLPTNYCESYDYEAIRVLMKALTNFWDVVRCSADGNFAPFCNQDYMRGLIAGVRYLLVKSIR